MDQLDFRQYTSGRDGTPVTGTDMVLDQFRGRGGMPLWGGQEQQNMKRPKRCADLVFEARTLSGADQVT